MLQFIVVGSYNKFQHNKQKKSSQLRGNNDTYSLFCIRPVSYTHLDVYKRQVLMFPPLRSRHLWIILTDVVFFFFLKSINKGFCLFCFTQSEEKSRVCDLGSRREVVQPYAEERASIIISTQLRRFLLFIMLKFIITTHYNKI